MPGWLAFPPSNDLFSPLGETWQTWGFKYCTLFVQRVVGLWNGADWPRDCAMEPDASNYASSADPRHFVASVGKALAGHDAAVEELRGMIERQAAQIAALQAQAAG